MALFQRIVQERWAETAMDGEGARRFGGRWNQAGFSAVYLAESRALAALEILVHAPREALQLRWVVIGVEIPDELIQKVPTARLPKDWRERPSSQGAQAFGTTWLREGESLALELPSVVIPQEHSLLLNPFHPQISRIKVFRPELFTFDSRLSS